MYVRGFRANALSRRITVAPWEQAVVHRDGVVSDVLAAGRHRLPRRSVAIILDVRPRALVVNSQEILSADAVGVRVSAVADVHVADARQLVLATADADAVLYQAIQIALRDAITTRSMADVLTSRAEISALLLDPARSAADRVGLGVSSVAVRDLSVSHEARVVLAEAALEAQRSQIALDRARTEVATTRALANAARIMAEHPGLLQLRMVQSAVGGAKVVIHSGGGSSE